MANVYDWNTVKENVSCLRYLTDKGIEISNKGRCAASWRGGVNKDSVHIEEKVWHDFASGDGGTVIDLCAVIECNGDRLVALRTLGERYNLEPKSKTRKIAKTRGEHLIEDGYHLAKTYTYTDENGTELYFVDRYEHPEKKKEFVQRTKDRESLDGVAKVLYNLPAVIKAQEVFIVEGEKDVETLRGMNFVATTNSGGGAFWEASFNAYFANKDVVIIADNDKTGEKHGALLYSTLLPIAKSVKCLTISALEKGDVTDWIEKEGGTPQKLREIVDAHRETTEAESPEVAMAKMLNLTPFSNYTGEGKKAMARSIGSLVEEIHNRFLGFPRILGDELFDWCKDDGDIKYFHNKNELFAWVQGTSGQSVLWGNGSGYVTKDELFSRLQQSSRRYDGISSAPHFPTRTDVFYTHGKLPPPDLSHSTFWELVAYFNPATPANRTLLAALLVAPMYFDRENRAPLFIVDTDDAQASGKTTLVEMASYLYGQEPLMIDFGLLNRDINQINRRILSSSARQKRIALLDNLTATIKSDNLAQLVTSKSISGIAPYGRGEVTRPNDLIYAITVNGASIDTDTASRSYTIRLKAPKQLRAEWRNEVIAFIDRNKPQLYADIIHMMQTAPKRDRHCRFGMFDQTVLSAVCRTDEEFSAVDASIRAESERANEDADRGAEFLELIHSRVASEVQNFDANRPFILRNADINFYLLHSSGSLKYWKVNDIKNLVKQGHIPTISRFFDRMPSTVDGTRFHGMFFGTDRMLADSDFTDAQVITYSQEDKRLTLRDNVLLKRNAVLKPESEQETKEEK